MRRNPSRRTACGARRCGKKARNIFERYTFRGFLTILLFLCERHREARTKRVLDREDTRGANDTNGDEVAFDSDFLAFTKIHFPHFQPHYFVVYIVCILPVLTLQLSSALSAFS